MTEYESRGLLADVPGSYAAFVDGIMADMREFGTKEEIIRFIADNPDATAGEVSDYSTQLSGLVLAMAQPQGVQRRTLEDIECPIEFESFEGLLAHVNNGRGEPVFFDWNGQEFVIDGLPTRYFERFDENAGKRDPFTEEFETADGLFELPFLDGESLRERFDECRFFVE